ncbi:heat shock factor-binding protein 1-like protein 1 [Ciconia maguari]
MIHPLPSERRAAEPPTPAPLPRSPAARSGRLRASGRDAHLPAPPRPREAGGRAAVRGSEPEAMAAADPPGAGDLSQLAEDLLHQLQEHFQAMTEKITLGMEEMGERIDDLEKHVADLMTEAGIQNTDEELRVPLQNFIGPMNINCSALQEMVVFAEVTAVQLLLFPQAHPKLCTPVQVTSSRYAYCANFISLTLAILMKEPKDFEREKNSSYLTYPEQDVAESKKTGHLP